MKVILVSKEYPVHEIFDSIQGEGYWTGAAASFVRLQQCNLRCAWCDSKGTWEGKPEKMTADEILAAVHSERVILTGGEPLLHDLTALLESLKAAGKKVHIETNGTQPWKESYPQEAWITVSPKKESGYLVQPSIKSKANEYKFVVDEDFSADILAQLEFNSCPNIFLSPENVRSEMIKKALSIVAQYPFCRLTLQLHKLIGVR
ncbi:Radical SAM domain protein [Syntrophobotulus glycolicus DSM 8271]|uniref:7-carboxy-7-deazaguanine synthase n=1 Tax=Syntrophobotulus glycolicus (strain DSM 8271 / FlGlyR) TaxID=645991 RepID=F0T104_SYNGF|nr:Radical SAM domain protein [Syntrophobotulus glycolicus DSM 8271]